MSGGYFGDLDGCFWPAAIFAFIGFAATIWGLTWLVLWLIDHVRFV